MKKNQVRFLKSASRLEECPPPDFPEIAIVGRSNAGKSSLVNAVFGRKIAKVSSTPGKTTLLNFFEVPESHRFVDMPGYGYAARGVQQIESWRSMIENYFSCRANLVGAVLVMDIRRDWKEEEEWLEGWFKSLKVPMAVVLSKSDKLNRTQRERQLRERKKHLDPSLLFCTTTSERKTFESLEEFLFNDWVLNEKGEGKP